MRQLIVIFILLTLTTTKAQAFSIEQAPVNVIEMLKTDIDAISWNVFAKTGEKEDCTTDETGYEECYIKPVYAPEILELDGKKVTIMGYIFPLTDSEKQTNFLIGPYPLSCPFHYHAKQALIVEVISDKAFDFSYDPIKITGTFKVKYNEDTGMFYYLYVNK